MSTEAITIEVDSKAAEVFKAAPRDEQKKMEVLLSLWLLDTARTKDRSLTDVMDEIGRNAQARGLTPEILESILNED